MDFLGRENLLQDSKDSVTEIRQGGIYLKGGGRMKKYFLVGLILALFTSYAYAQIAGQEGGAGKEMMRGQKGQIIGHKELMDNMTGMMNQMSGMIEKMPKMMMEEMPPPDVRKMMFQIMRDMSKQMMDMSKMIEKGAASEKQIKRMQDRMTQMQKRMKELEAKN